jgi:hypothetical protein
MSERPTLRPVADDHQTQAGETCLDLRERSDQEHRALLLREPSEEQQEAVLKARLHAVPDPGASWPSEDRRVHAHGPQDRVTRCRQEAVQRITYVTPVSQHGSATRDDVAGHHRSQRDALQQVHVSGMGVQNQRSGAAPPTRPGARKARRHHPVGVHDVGFALFDELPRRPRLGGQKRGHLGFGQPRGPQVVSHALTQGELLRPTGREVGESVDLHSLQHLASSGARCVRCQHGNTGGGGKRSGQVEDESRDAVPRVDRKRARGDEDPQSTVGRHGSSRVSIRAPRPPNIILRC